MMRPTEQSDLRLFERIEALAPTTLYARWMQLKRRTRWLVVITLASLVLAAALMTLSNAAIEHIDNTRGPFLEEALVAPYQIAARALPSADRALLATVGGYRYHQDSAETPVTYHRSGQCLLQIDSDKAAICGLDASVKARVSGGYLRDDGAAVSVVAAQLSSSAEVSAAMPELVTFSDQNGSIGNFSVGGGNVDYFYSREGDRYAFTWSRADWIYTASSTSFAALEDWLGAFSY